MQEATEGDADADCGVGGVGGVGGRKMMSFGGGTGGSGSGAGAGADAGGVSLRELRCAGELSVRVRRTGWEGGADKAGGVNTILGRTASAGITLGGFGNNSKLPGAVRGVVMTGDGGVGGVGGSGGESKARISRSEILLARRPRPLGGRISGEGGDGDLLGERGHGTVEICWMAEVAAEVEVEEEEVR